MAYIIKPDEETAKIFSDKTRLKIVELLSEKELTNSQLVRMLNLSKLTISHHLKLLLDAGILAGVLDTIFGKRYCVIETKCWGTGYDLCEFEIKEL
jgi:DNA-binding transcriptional ArsR family regulator